MRRPKAFTLIELMVVVSIIALLAAMLLPALQRALEMTRRTNCMGQVNGLGKGLAMYAQENNSAYPMLPGGPAQWDQTADGKWYLPTASQAPYNSSTGLADWTDGRSVSGLLFLLVRDGQSSKMFCCPSDGKAIPDPATQTVVNNVNMFNWDFSTGQQTNGPGFQQQRNLSYSYQVPLHPVTGNDSNGVPLGADPGLIILADRNPMPSYTASGAFKGAGTANWASTLNVPGSVNFYNSQNHTAGQVQNVLYSDSHAASVSNPDVGCSVTSDGNQDCIYTAFMGSATNYPQDGSDYSGTCSATAHYGNRDTYLWGGTAPAGQ